MSRLKRFAESFLHVLFAVFGGVVVVLVLVLGATTFPRLFFVTAMLGWLALVAWELSSQ